MSYQHLRLTRESPVTERHPRKPKPPYKPSDPYEFGQHLGQKFQYAKAAIDQQNSPGFDNRRLIKIVLRAGEIFPKLEDIHGVEIVSQEARTVILAFIDNEAVNTFESRLATLAREGKVTRKELLYVIEDFDRWSPEDRLGAALREQGWPDSETFRIDVELWPQDRSDRRDAMLQSFVDWAIQRGMEKLDTLKQVSLVIVRLRCRPHHADVLLNYRDVRTVDLPPQFGVSVSTLLTGIDQFPPVPAPESGVPCIGVLDSGITSSHPLLKPAMGDAQGYVLPNLSPNDAVPNGHGTFVAGLALYGDVAGCIRGRQFIPELRLLSGKVFQDDGNDQTEFVEKAIEKAVRYFLDNYQCRVFNLSYGDLNKVYDGRRVRGLAYTLDRLTRELNVLFVVPTGNLNTGALPENPQAQYPAYLLSDSARLLDPATALNAITVGGIATLTASRNAQRHQDTLEDIPIAQPSQPAPFTRCGLSVGGAIKPDLVEEAGSLAVMRDGNRTQQQGLGIVSFNSGFASGTLFNEDIGTSFASPMVAHKAAKLLAVLPEASANLLRALLAAHARWPDASKRLLNADNKAGGRNQLLQLVGYGRVQEEAMYQSLAQTVTLLAEDKIAQNKHHFYELPVPDEFLTANRRTREVTVALAYSPAVRTTRLDYRHTKLSFSLVAASSLAQVEQAFTRGREQGLAERSTNRLIPDDTRKKGTLQMSRWTFQGRLGDGKKLFVVITRQDAAWSNAQDEDESYALTVTLNDRENVNVTVSLYDRIQALLNIRVQQRIRLRTRG
ncbi:MAG TPA: S8 family peptidase [Thiolinea sp.]|nr:S8 family peptidase [Thiolinea sp.]